MDALLQRLAGLLTAQAAGLFVGRLGGDEFFAFVHDEQMAEAAAQTIQQTMEDFARSRGFLDRGRLWQDHDFEYTPPLGTVTIGLARVNPTGCTAADVLRDADEAMYAGKRAGRNRLHWADD